MGNYASCTLSTPLGKSSRYAKVVFPGGEVKQILTPTKAAELMLEMPNCFLVNSQSLKVGRRFSPLNADEDLEARNVYVLFPMKRVKSMITAGDMGALFMAAKRGSSGKVRILPADQCGEGMNDKINEETEVPKLNLDEVEEFSQPEFMHRLSMSRSKKPLLETIVEEPVCSR
ncbi:uncharacterized protein LOC123226339 [Mangifera indica]|uniref:uncharacterized protein LOC123226339 n=1 Tax=Mangifera indica TaxID=29780 RepID=UPI001CFA72A0|nr:uncharacterized protein LOC123226339 [Mangifera indica]